MTIKLECFCLRFYSPKMFRKYLIILHRCVSNEFKLGHTSERNQFVKFVVVIDDLVCPSTLLIIHSTNTFRKDKYCQTESAP